MLPQSSSKCRASATASLIQHAFRTRLSHIAPTWEDSDVAGLAEARLYKREHFLDVPRLQPVRKMVRDLLIFGANVL